VKSWILILGAALFGAAAAVAHVLAIPAVALTAAWGWAAHLERRESVKALAAIHNELAKVVDAKAAILADVDRRLKAVEVKILPESVKTFGPRR